MCLPVRNQNEFDNNTAAPFKPDFNKTNLFGEIECFVGYENQKISIFYTAATLESFYTIEYKAEANAVNSDVKKIFSKLLMPNVCENRDKFLEKLKSEETFTPGGRFVSNDYEVEQSGRTHTYKFAAYDHKSPGFIRIQYIH